MMRESRGESKYYEYDRWPIQAKHPRDQIDNRDKLQRALLLYFMNVSFYIL